MPKSIITFIMLSISGCSWTNFPDKYQAYSNETYYEIILNKNQSFVYKFKGHRGNLEYKGNYEIINDTLILNEPEKKLEENKFLIYGSQCLIESHTRLTYCIK